MEKLWKFTKPNLSLRFGFPFSTATFIFFANKYNRISDVQDVFS